MKYFLLCLSVFAASAKTILSKLCEKKTVHLFNAGVFAVGLVSLALLGIGSSYQISGYTACMAIFYAACTLVAQMFTYRAVRLGDIAVTSLIYYCGFIIPTVFSVFVWNESFGLLKGLGFCLILCSFVLGTKKSGDDSKVGGKSWLIAAFTAMLGSGCVGIVQRIFSHSSHNGELNGMLLLAFAIVIVFSLAAHFLFERRNNAEKQEERAVETPKKKRWVTVVAACTIGVAMAAANKINSYLPGVMDGVVFFPVVNGGSILLGMIGGILFFQEKPTKRKIAAILVGVLAIVLTVL